MTINEHLETFAGLPVVTYPPTGPVDPASVAWRIDVDDGGGAWVFTERLDALLAADWAGQVRALVIGEWGESYDVGAADRPPGRRGRRG